MGQLGELFREKIYRKEKWGANQERNAIGGFSKKNQVLQWFHNQAMLNSFGQCIIINRNHFCKMLFQIFLKFLNSE